MVKMTKSFNLNFDMNFDMNSDMKSDLWIWNVCRSLDNR